MKIWMLLLLAFLASMSVFFQFLSCVLYNNWWPMIMRAHLTRTHNCSHTHLAPLPTPRRWHTSGVCIKHAEPYLTPPVCSLSAVLTYTITALPAAALARARGDGLLESGNASAQHWSEFVLACCVSLCVGVPFAMYHSQVVELGAVLLALCAFVLATGTMALAVVFNRLSAEE